MLKIAKTLKQKFSSVMNTNAIQASPSPRPVHFIGTEHNTVARLGLMHIILTVN